MKSWKTTIGGILLGISPIVKNGLPPHLAWIGDVLLTAGGIILGASARDNNVTSEQANAKPLDIPKP